MKPESQGDNKTLLCVYNPLSSSGKVKERLPALNQVMEKQGIDYHYLELIDPDFKQLLNAQIQELQPDSLMGIGGDGTHFSIINTLKELEAEGLKLPAYAFCPFGTGNDIAKSIGLKPGPAHYDAIIRCAINGDIADYDLGQLILPDKKQYFADMVSLGMDCRILDLRDRLTGKIRKTFLKYIFHGYSIYALAAIWGLLRNKQLTLKVHVDETLFFEGDCCGLLINDCPVHAGEFILCPDAAYDDGKLDLLILKSRRDYLRSYLKGGRKRQRRAADRVGLGIQGQHFKIELPSAAALQVDGEMDKERKGEIIIACAPAALKIRRP